MSNQTQGVEGTRGRGLYGKGGGGGTGVVVLVVGRQCMRGRRGKGVMSVEGE